MAKIEEKSNGLQELKLALREKKPAHFYIFHGEERFLLQHYLTQLKKLMIDDLTESFNYHKLTNETFSVRSFAECVENLPMMAESTMIVVDEIDIFKLPEADREKMMQVISDIPEYCTVVFCYETTPWNPDKRLKKLWEAVQKNASIVAFEKQSLRDLSAWITRHFAANKKTITQELCEYLIEITGGTMTALAGEISKICAYSGATAIVKSDIDAVTEPVLEAAVFRMADRICSGECGVALVQLQKLLKMQQEPLMILGGMGSHFRRLSTARALLDNGKSSDQLMKLYSIGDYAARKTMSAAGKLSARFYRSAAELILETDRNIKTSFDTPERLLELLVIRLSQEAAND